jgi:coiled-coil domain-containing protein 77
MQALSDAQQFLFEERQRLLLLQAENDELKLQEIQDRQRIQQLLALTQPLEQTVTYKQGGAPSSITAYLKPTGAAGAAAGLAAAAGTGRVGSPGRTGRGGQQQQQQQQGAGAAAGGGERVLRTVFLPTVDSEFLLLKVESLQAQLNEQVRNRMNQQPCLRCCASVLSRLLHRLKPLQQR